MMPTFDITEKLQVDLTSEKTSVSYQNSGLTYDVAVDNQAFFDASSAERPYRRETAQYRKDQQDNSAEPGEQSLTGWWLRSQSSFHLGAGIRFYEPAQDQTLRYRFDTSQGLDVWTPGEVSLLRDVTSTHVVTSTDRTQMRSIRYGTTNAVLLHDNFDVDKITAAGVDIHFIDYNAGTSEKVYAICDDGVDAYWVTNTVSGGANKLHMFKKPLTGDTTTGVSYPSVTGDVIKMFDATGVVVASATMDWVKGRIIACINNSVYELTGASSSLGTAIFSAPTGFVFTDITASASNIYLSGYLGDSSHIYRLPLGTNGAFTTLTSGVVVAEMPRGEVVWSIQAYLGYLAIGTSKGVRIAQLLDDGGLVYGPLLFESSQPVYQFAARDRFVWAACGVGSDAGLVRIDLSTQIDQLRFPYANDVQAVGIARTTGGCAFMNGTDRIAFTSLNNGTNGTIYIEAESTLRSSGYILTGRIRFNTTEDKYFKYVKERADYTNGGFINVGTATTPVITVSSSAAGNRDIAVGEPEAAESKQFRFELNRNPSDSTKGPVLSSYQIKAIPAARRQRLIQYHLWCYDTEADRYGNWVGHEGRAFERITDLENLESFSNITSIQDFRTGEVFDAIIEQIQFTSTTPPSKNFSGFGGILVLTVRKL